MTIETFPSVNPSYPVEIEENFKTLVNEFGSGGEVSLTEWRFPKRTVTIPFGNLPVANRNSIHDFFRLMRGRGTSFWFLDNCQQKWSDEYMGYGTGAALTLDLHTKSTAEASVVIKEDGVTQVKDTDYTFISGGGEAGVDRITWIVGHYPAAGALITSDSTGLLRIKAKLDDKFSQSWTKHLRFAINLTFYEIQW